MPNREQSSLTQREEGPLVWPTCTASAVMESAILPVWPSPTRSMFCRAGRDGATAVGGEVGSIGDRVQDRDGHCLRLCLLPGESGIDRLALRLVPQPKGRPPAQASRGYTEAWATEAWATEPQSGQKQVGSSPLGRSGTA